jgi:hypothetical protein
LVDLANEFAEEDFGFGDQGAGAVNVPGEQRFLCLFEIGTDLSGGLFLRLVEGAAEGVEAVFRLVDGVVGLAVEVTWIAGGELADGADTGRVWRGRRRDDNLLDGTREMVMVDGSEGFLVNIFVGFKGFKGEECGVIG